MKGWVLFRILGALLLVLAVVLTLADCRVWDNPADPDGVNYQGYHTVKSADEVQAHTPIDGGSLVLQRFIISEARGAEAYHLQIASSADFGNTLYDGNSHAVNIMSADAPLSLNTDYYWRGRAKQDGQWGKWTDGWKFTMTTIGGLSPADGASTTDTTPTLSWTAVPGAASYEMRIADSPAGLNSAPSASETGPSHTPTSALTNLQTHYWQVRAKDGAGQFGAWSTTHSLRVEWGAVSGLNPADGASTTDTTPTLSWTAVPGAASYELRIADSESGLTSASSDIVTGTTHTPASALTNEQTHYWQVRAKDGAGQFGAWSAAHSLRVEWGAVSGLNPADGSTTEDTTPTLSWTAVPGAAGYEVRIADSLGGLNSAPSASKTGPSHTPTSALTGLQTHYWQVRAKDGAGQFGAWSTVASIRITSSIGGSGPAGGIIFYDKGSYSDGWRYLEAAPSDQGRVEWGGYETKVGGTSTAIGSGKSNTAKIVTALGTGNYAARLCYDFELGGYDDWFLPSKDELNELYKQKDTVGGFASGGYWSSSEGSSYYAWLQYFGSGYQLDYLKDDDKSVRAVRAF